MNAVTRWAFILGLLCVTTPANAGDLRVDGLLSKPPERVLIFVARGEGVATPIVDFQSSARSAIEKHTHARVVTAEEAFVRGGAAFQEQLADCRGEVRCYARLVGSVDATHLLVIAASVVGDETVLGSKYIDLDAAKALGNAVDTVSAGAPILSKLTNVIQESMPADRWDPFGFLRIESNVPGAEVTVQSRMVGVAPVERIGYLLPGEYEVMVNKSGFVPAKQIATVSRGQTQTVSFTLEEESSSGWVLWTVLGAVAIAGAATAVAIVATSGGDPTFCSSPDPMACM